MLHTIAASPKPQLEACFVQTIKNKKTYLGRPQPRTAEGLRDAELHCYRMVRKFVSGLAPASVLQGNRSGQQNYPSLEPQVLEHTLLTLAEVDSRSLHAEMQLSQHRTKHATVNHPAKRKG